ncbi:MAG: DsbA family protein [Chitinophagaceae bacterium]|nr:DsbA family protein [Chitinophagaceae bacterium]
MTPTLYYCYDAYCGWCYGFSPVIRRIFEQYRGRLAFEVLSGGMILPEKPQPIGVMAPYIQKAYKTVEEHTGIKFGSDWLWHIFHPDESDWYPSSEKPAIAMCVFKDYHPGMAIPFAADLQYALHEEGRDLTDDEAYRHLLEKYKISDQEFFARLHSVEYKEKAYEEFALIKQLGVTGFPTVFLQVSESRVYLLCRGYTDFATLQGGIERTLEAAAKEAH